MFIIEALATGGGRGNAGSNRPKTGYSRGVQAVGRRPAPRKGESQSEYMTRGGSAFGRVTSQNGHSLRSARAVNRANLGTAMGNRGVRGL